ncbi:MAG: SDR family NAD(P)-dependent oxidoreductase [Candidatus Gracilibacteria bacterium]
MSLEAPTTPTDTPEQVPQYYLVTGATSGIGFETSKKLLAEGKHVIGMGNREKEAVPAELKNDIKFHYVRTDLRDPGQIEASREKIEAIIGETHAKINGVLLCAGGLTGDSKITGKLEETDMYKVNAESPALLMTTLTADPTLLAENAPIIYVHTLSAGPVDMVKVLEDRPTTETSTALAKPSHPLIELLEKFFKSPLRTTLYGTTDPLDADTPPRTTAGSGLKKYVKTKVIGLLKLVEALSATGLLNRLRVFSPGACKTPMTNAVVNEGTDVPAEWTAVEAIDPAIVGTQLATWLQKPWTEDEKPKDKYRSAPGIAKWFVELLPKPIQDLFLPGFVWANGKNSLANMGMNEAAWNKNLEKHRETQGYGNVPYSPLKYKWLAPQKLGQGVKELLTFLGLYE